MQLSCLFPQPLCVQLVFTPGAKLCSFSALRCGPAPAGRRFLPPGSQEEGSLQQGAAEGAGEGIRQQQIHHQGQEEEDRGRHQPHGETDYHLVSEQEGEREESGRQSQNQQHPVRKQGQPHYLNNTAATPAPLLGLCGPEM